MTAIIIGKPKTYPVFAGSMPSQVGGRRNIVIGSVDPDGNWDIKKEDQGPERDCNEPILFVPFGGVDYALTVEDLKEMVAGMRERHQSWREKQAPTPDLTLAAKNFAQRILDSRNGRKQFSVGGIA